MDYTTLERVKQQMDAQTTVNDTRLAVMITAASRAIDRKCTGVPDNDAADYFKAEDRTETLTGQADNHGVIFVYPHKPIVNSLTAIDYRETPVSAWINVPVGRTWADGPRVQIFPSPTSLYSTRCQVRISYNGGLAATVSGLPADLIEAATILSIRFYKEAETGLTDAIGVAELATMIYTKAWPTRVLDQIQSFMRTAGWRYLA